MNYYNRNNRNNNNNKFTAGVVLLLVIAVADARRQCLVCDDTEPLPHHADQHADQKDYSCLRLNEILDGHHHQRNHRQHHSTHDLSDFIAECAPGQNGCLTQIKGTQMTRTCDRAINDCKTANGVRYCYCDSDLCNNKTLQHLLSIDSTTVRVNADDHDNNNDRDHQHGDENDHDHDHDHDHDDDDDDEEEEEDDLNDESHESSGLDENEFRATDDKTITTTTIMTTKQLAKTVDKTLMTDTTGTPNTAARCHTQSSEFVVLIIGAVYAVLFQFI